MIIIINGICFLVVRGFYIIKIIPSDFFFKNRSSHWTKYCDLDINGQIFKAFFPFDLNNFSVSDWSLEAVVRFPFCIHLLGLVFSRDLLT